MACALWELEKEKHNLTNEGNEGDVFVLSRDAIG